MGITRAPRPESGFYTLDKRISEDSRLSWIARAVLIFLLGKPDYWQISIEHLRKQTEKARIKTGRDGIYAVIDELQLFGYIERLPQQRDANGRLGDAEYSVTEKAVQKAPSQDEPRTDEPYTADPTQAITISKQSLKREKKAPRKALTLSVVSAMTIPDCVDRNLWKMFAEHRAEIKKPMSENAAGLMLEKLETFGAGANPALKASIENGWQGVFEPKSTGKGMVVPGSGMQPPQSKTGQAFARLESMKQKYRDADNESRDGEA